MSATQLYSITPIYLNYITFVAENFSMQKHHNNNWLPTSSKEIKLLGWSEVDVIIFSGDAYVDHPSFGPAVIGRWLEH